MAVYGQLCETCPFMDTAPNQASSWQIPLCCYPQCSSHRFHTGDIKIKTKYYNYHKSYLAARYSTFCAYHEFKIKNTASPPSLFLPDR
jgi:hypothetical protein